MHVTERNPGEEAPSTARSPKGTNYRHSPFAPSGDDGKHDRNPVSPGSLRSPGAMQMDSLRGRNARCLRLSKAAETPRGGFENLSHR
jgi:hypothetical protein